MPITANTLAYFQGGAGTNFADPRGVFTPQEQFDTPLTTLGATSFILNLPVPDVATANVSSALLSTKMTVIAATAGVASFTASITGGSCRILVNGVLFSGVNFGPVRATPSPYTLGSFSINATVGQQFDITILHDANTVAGSSWQTLSLSISGIAVASSVVTATPALPARKTSLGAVARAVQPAQTTGALSAPRAIIAGNAFVGYSPPMGASAQTAATSVLNTAAFVDNSGATDLAGLGDGTPPIGVDQLQLMLSEADSYEEASQAYDSALNGLDVVYVRSIQKRCFQIASELAPFAGSPIVAGYIFLARQLGALTVMPTIPLDTLLGSNLAWTGPTNYSTIASRVGLEYSALASTGTVSGRRIADSLQANAFRARNTNNYDADVVIPSLVEAATQSDFADSSATQTDFIEQYAEAVIALPRATLGSRPTYTVTAEDTLETIARNVFGDADAWTSLVERYHLEPPYISSQPRRYALFPGVRIVIPHDAQTLAASETFGATWGIDVTGLNNYDLAVDSATGLVGLEGFAAVETELLMMAGQPYGDWAEPELADYGVPEYLIGEYATSGITADFAFAAALLNDDRVLASTPISFATSQMSGVAINRVLVTPIPTQDGR